MPSAANTQVQFAQQGVVDLIAQSGPMAKMVLLVLILASVYTWGIILAKRRALKLAERENEKFLKVFWASKSIEEIFGRAEEFPHSPVANVFKAGFKELKKFATDATHVDPFAVDNVARSLSRTASAEIAVLEKNISFLATTASAAPFVGLFGTVWGIMNSFQNIGATGAANLAVVAPGISEALITTATGIGAAIPAVIAYNHFANQIKRNAIEIDTFTQDFLNIVQRSALHPTPHSH